MGFGFWVLFRVSSFIFAILTWVLTLGGITNAEGKAFSRASRREAARISAAPGARRAWSVRKTLLLRAPAQRAVVFAEKRGCRAGATAGPARAGFSLYEIAFDLKTLTLRSRLPGRAKQPLTLKAARLRAECKAAAFGQTRWPFWPSPLPYISLP